MKNPMVKLSIAAVIAIAVIVLVGIPWSPSITLADVLKPILNFHTISLDFLVGTEGSEPVIHDIIKGNRIRRTMSNSDMVIIIDLDDARMLTMDPSTQTASYVDIQGTMHLGASKILEMVRDVAGKIQDHPDIVTQELGRRDIDGIEVHGFHIDAPYVDFDIWADPVSALPKRIELTTGQAAFIIKNLVFDIPVADHEVSMDVPSGYTLSEHTPAVGEGSEEDLIALLRFWAGRFRDGTFPDELSVQKMMRLVPKFEALEGTEEEKTQLGMHYARAMMYLQILDQRGERHYAGQGVRLGDSETAIFWYRDGDVKTYRVIYGDLHVEDVSLEKLPK